MSWLRNVLFSNWRNKSVALFFAITIWYVAYQSEKKEFTPTVRITVQPENKDFIVKSVHVLRDGAGGSTPFAGNVLLTFTGPRKEIDKLRDNPILPPPIRIPTDSPRYVLRQEDFDFPRDGVEITRFDPEVLLVSQEARGERTIANLAEKIQVLNFQSDYEVVQRETIPTNQEIRITGPKSIVDVLDVKLNVTMGFLRDRFEGEADVQVVVPADVPDELVRRTIQVIPPKVRVLAAVRAGMDAFSVDSMRITFRVPPNSVPLKIVMEEVVGNLIAVEFYGPRDEISDLRELLRQKPSFSLGVPLPSFDMEQGGQFTFTEDTLELYGFPGVRIRQHESRKKENKGAWSYTIVPVKESSN